MNDDLEFLLYRIICGYLIFNYNNDKYILKYADYNLRYEAQILYNNIINDEKYNEWIREEYLDNMLISLGLWTKDTEMIVKSIEKKIENAKVDYFNNFNFNDKKNSIKKSLNSYKDQIHKILIKKEELYSNTLEGYANSIKNEFIITNSLYKNNNLIFKDNIGQANYTLFNNIVSELNKYNISLSSFKMLARSNLWKSYWNSSKNNTFKSCAIDMTDDQRTLIGVSQMYDRVYDHPDCPIDAVIDDDDALDGWMIVQKRKIEKDKKQQQVDSLNPKLKNAQEVFLVANNNQEAEEIVSLNSPDSLRRMNSKINYVKQVGSANESNLPDVQMDLRNQLNEKLKNRK